MCTRYFVERQFERMRAYVEDAQSSPLFRRFAENGKTEIASGEIFPTDIVPVIAADRKGGTSVFPMKWGFQIPNRSLVVNARIETASSKISFRDSWKEHRCIVPASYYFEWKHYTDSTGKKRTGEKCSVRSDDDGLIWMCGLYRIENGLPVFVVLTRDAAGEVAAIHDRMPVMLEEDSIQDWISPGADPGEVLNKMIDNVTVVDSV